MPVTKTNSKSQSKSSVNNQSSDSNPPNDQVQTSEQAVCLSLLILLFMFSSK